MNRSWPYMIAFTSSARRRGGTAIKGAVRMATSTKVLRSRVGAQLWRGALSAPGIPDRVRVRLAGRVHESMIKVGGGAGLAPEAVTRRIRSPRQRVDLLTTLAAAELACGHVPARLTEAWATQLAVADALHRDGDEREAARSLARAMAIGFHRVLHFDRLASPLAENPGEFLAPLHASSAVRAMSAQARTAPAAAVPPGRPLRLLVATRANANFLTEIRQRYEALPEVEVRFLDLAADSSREPLTRGNERLLEHLLAGRSAFGERVEEWLRPHLDWADTVFIDWCVSTAALLTLVDPGTTRIIVRLHSFELFSRWPHLVSFARVDDLVVVGEHMRDLAMAVVPQLRTDTAPRVHVIPNAMRLRPYHRPKPAEARFTLGLVGVGSVAKDPRWAIEVVRRLRDRDSRYRLLLIGDGLNPRASAAVAEYHKLLERDCAELEPSGAVRRLGHTGDVPAALSEVGVILSTSVRESFHVALVEGAASGAVPVVRDWPFFAGKANGARTLFPATGSLTPPIRPHSGSSP